MNDVPNSFFEGLEDYKQGRLIDMETALNKPPPIDWDKLTEDEKNHLIHKEIFEEVPCDKWTRMDSLCDDMVLLDECPHSTITQSPDGGRIQKSNCYPANRPSHFVSNAMAAKAIIDHLSDYNFVAEKFKVDDKFVWSVQFWEGTDYQEATNSCVVTHKSFEEAVCIAALVIKGFVINYE